MMMRRLVIAALGAALAIGSAAPAFADSWKKEHRREHWDRGLHRGWDKKHHKDRYVRRLPDNVYVNRDGRAIVVDEVVRVERPRSYYVQPELPRDRPSIVIPIP